MAFIMKSWIWVLIISRKKHLTRYVCVIATVNETPKSTSISTAQVLHRVDRRNVCSAIEIMSLDEVLTLQHQNNDMQQKYAHILSERWDNIEKQRYNKREKCDEFRNKPEA